MSRKYGYLMLLLAIIVVAGCGTGRGGSQGQPSSLVATSTASSSGVALPGQVATSQATVGKTAVTARPTQGRKPAPTPRTQPTPGPSGPSGPYGAPPAQTGEEAQLSQQLFNLINSDRAAQGGLYAYTLNATMSSGARLHSWNMAHCGLSHQCPGEAAPCQRVSNEGIQWMACGENVGYSSPYPSAWGGVQSIEKAMLNEPPPAGHRYNLLNTSYHHIGVGIYIDAKGLVWVTEDFAS
ncbi:MAG: CAP domain-containing protein [Chloroflexota bacterium]|nr:CAP domain-containing protein [Chloroflexota bacterium]